ncbi:MAG: hypothetical protein OWT27_09260, partial [Firmicutes bacterium]|nr:hypothetical protein [Bacillota bacterium]
FFTLIFSMFIAIDPFQTTNPFLRQITIGQSIIGDWRYGGSQGGRMRFYDAYQAVTIPDSARTFAADGAFVDIDGHTPTTITYEPTYESETIGPTVFVTSMLFAGAGIAAVVRYGRRRRSPRLATGGGHMTGGVRRTAAGRRRFGSRRHL